MQYTLPLAPFDRIASLHQRLLAVFGPPADFVRLDPVSQMLLAMLSARTRNETALKVFAGLVEYFEVAKHKGSWARLAEAPFHEIDPLLEGITHPERKAVALPRALQEIVGLRGALSLDFLHAWPVESGLSWLERIYGVGPKTGTATLNMSTLRKRILVVDTAHWRAARCLGLIPRQASPERSVRLLNRQLPNRWEAADTEQHHILMQDLGRTFCARNRNSDCPFGSVCVHSAKLVASAPRERLLEEWLRDTSIPIAMHEKGPKTSRISPLETKAANLNQDVSRACPVAQTAIAPAVSL
ncbi:iron-sulfur cluster loop [uncultured Nitratireductor sp.]|uniref:endonuclease III domain-containing protein n=1 Tax=uncultured Nitratireductor sp. TaxID=520953 RepID=UPI0025E5FEC1|nr:iron-sulfur cluster loop [uncultured Nitratireductor sp.]